MRVNQNYEAELNLKDLLFHILYKWWVILLVGLLVAGFFGLKEYWSFEKYHREGKLTPAEEQYDVDVTLYQNKLAQAESALAEFENVNKSNNGGQGVSILMLIDPTNVWTAEKNYYVNVKPSAEELNSGKTMSEASTRILAVLSEAFSENIDAEKLTEVFGTDARRDINRVASININPELRTLSVVGCGATEEEATKRREFVNSYLLAANEKLTKTEQYELEVLNENVGTKDYLTTKNTNGEKIKTDLARLQQSLNTNYRNYLSLISSYANERNELLAKPPVKPEPKIKQQALFGFALGAFLVVVICVIGYLFNGKIKTEREIKKRYDLALLSDFTHSRGLWKGKGIDKLLEKMEFGKKTNIDNELDSITSLIQKEKDGDRILLTSTLDEKKLRNVYDGLAARLEKKGIELILQPEYLHNSDAVSASEKLDSVIWLEEKYLSKVRDLNRMAEMLSIEDAKVIGAILL